MIGELFRKIDELSADDTEAVLRYSFEKLEERIITRERSQEQLEELLSELMDKL